MDRDVAFRGRRGATHVLVAVVAAGLLTLPGSVSPAPDGAAAATPFVEVMAHKKPVRQHPRKPAVKKPKKYLFHRGMMTPEDLWHLYAEPYATQRRLKAPTAHSPLVAVVESGSYGGRVYRDLARYRSHFGLPPCRPCVVLFWQPHCSFWWIASYCAIEPFHERCQRSQIAMRREFS